MRGASIPKRPVAEVIPFEPRVVGAAMEAIIKRHSQWNSRDAADGFLRGVAERPADHRSADWRFTKARGVQEAATDVYVCEAGGDTGFAQQLVVELYKELKNHH